MSFATLAEIAFWLAALPVLHSGINWWLFRPLPPAPNAAAHDADASPISLLIPARNEEDNIGALVGSALASKGVTLEVVVLDDHSTDRTAAIVQELAAADPRVRLEQAPPLPEGWSGKQHACAHLASLARHDLMVFIDADVTLSPDALARMAAEMCRRDLDMLSGFPRQFTESWGEKLTVPNIFVFLIGYLPMLGERLSNFVGFACGCGQLIAVRRPAYQAAGTHAVIKTSMHDGVKLPRVFRAARRRTRVFDATDVAACRMYRSFAQAWQGFAKNATEGMATPIGLPIWFVLLFGGHILPFMLLLYAVLTGQATSEAGITVAFACFWLMVWRLAHEWRLRGSLSAGLVHPVGIAVALAIQVYALQRQLRGGQAQWRGRAYSASEVGGG